MTNEKVPERIWIDTDDVVGAQRRGVGSYYVRPAPDDASNREAEYVRADLLATMRKEEREAAFKDAIEIVKRFEEVHCIVVSLEAALTEK